MERARLLLAAALLLPTSAWPQEHAEVRQFVIRSQLDQAGDNAVVFLGDSITESALLPSKVCGYPLINAGVGGSTVNSYLRSILAGVPRFKASAIVVALGTNDALSSNQDFVQDYERLVDILSTYTDVLLLAGLPSSGDSFDQEIRSIARRKDRPFIDVRSENELPTIDGIHLSTEGYKPWMRVMLGSISAALHC